MFKNSMLLILFIFSVTTFGRSPAVEPVTGIDISKYQEVDPAKDPGFDWNQGKYVRETSLVTTRTPAQRALIERTTNQRKTWPTYVFLLGLVSLPFALWYSIMKGLKGKEDHAVANVSSSEGYTNNTVDLNSEREKRRKENGKDDISKAS